MPIQPGRAGPDGEELRGQRRCPIAPREGQGLLQQGRGLSVSALIGLFFQGAVGILVFQWLQTSSPKYCPPPLAWFAAL